MRRAVGALVTLTAAIAGCSSTPSVPGPSPVLSSRPSPATATRSCSPSAACGSPSALHAPFLSLQLIRMVSASVGWAVESATDRILRTTDHLGGQQGQLPLDCGKGVLEFLTPATGVLGEGCTSPEVQVLVTHDGGLTWAVVALAPASQSASQSTTPLRVGSRGAYVFG